MQDRTTVRDGACMQATAHTDDSLMQIEALCGVIIVITLLSAYTTRYAQLVGHTGPIAASADWGFLSLQMFFAITSYQLLKDIGRHADWMPYAADRLRRFVPAVIPAVLLSYALVAGSHIKQMHADLTMLLANATMLADFVGIPDFDGAFWRLKIEIMFSAALGLIWFGLGARAAAAIMLLALLVCLVHAQPNLAHQTVLAPVGMVTIDGYLPNLTFGVALYFVTERQHVRFWLLVGAISSALIVASNTAQHGAIVLCAYGVIAAAAAGRLPGLTRVAPLTALGRIFFAVYLVHQSVGFVLIHELEGRGISPEVAVCAAAAAAIACGVAVHCIAQTLRADGRIINRRAQDVLPVHACPRPLDGMMLPVRF